MRPKSLVHKERKGLNYLVDRRPLLRREVTAGIGRGKEGEKSGVKAFGRIEQYIPAFWPGAKGENKKL